MADYSIEQLNRKLIDHEFLGRNLDKFRGLFNRDDKSRLCGLRKRRAIQIMDHRQKRRPVLLAVAALAMPLVAKAAPAPGDTINWKNCASVDECTAALARETAINGGQSYAERFEQFGAPAVAPLMNLIINGDERLSALAAQAAWRLPTIDASFLPALIALDRRGNPMAFSESGRGWLAHVIGRIKTDEALDYLFDTMAVRPEGGIHNGAGPAIQRFGRERYLVQVRRRLEGFPEDGNPSFLANLVDLANGSLPLQPEPMPAWAETALVRIATDSRMNVQARETAEHHLQAFKHPIALAAVACCRFDGHRDWLIHATPASRSKSMGLRYPMVECLRMGL